jgi:hypothetical protein
MANNIINSNEILNYNEVTTQGLNVNRAINNKWIGFIPLENALGKNFASLELDLIRFTIPSIHVGTATSSFKGVTVELPTKVINPDTREITFEYFVNENWYNYRALYYWASGLGTINPVVKSAYDAVSNGQSASSALNITSSATNIYTDLLDCKVWLLDNYKQKIITFVFHNCFIKEFSDLALDYSQADIVQHSFTMAYTNFTIEDEFNFSTTPKTTINATI